MGKPVVVFFIFLLKSTDSEKMKFSSRSFVDIAEENT